jgi:23S rRNA (cytosine1962-C5)-methyltransferase
MAAGVNPIVSRVTLKRGREGPVRGGNPWIFSQAIERIDPPVIDAGAPVTVLDSSGALLGSGYCNPKTTIAVRMLAWGESPPLPKLVSQRLASALDLRARLIREDTDCYRLLNGDGDGLSGVVVDRYADMLVLQLLTAGADAMRATLVSALNELLTPRAILERSVGAVRRQEGLADSVAVLAGEPIAETVVRENGIRIQVDFEHGQKTGYFLDQRDNRARVREIASGARVLDAYCYSGGFALAALAGGASRVVAIDTSQRALDSARRNLQLNRYSEDAIGFVHGEAGKYLAETSERFDLIVLDPPPLARSRGDADRAGRLYVELNALAIRKLTRGGRLLTFSCSTHFRAEDFMRAVRFAAANAGRQLRMIAHLGPGGDHPVLLGHVEGEYLTGLMLWDL